MYKYRGTQKARRAHKRSAAEISAEPTELDGSASERR
jgi:hypothetical protein